MAIQEVRNATEQEYDNLLTTIVRELNNGREVVRTARLWDQAIEVVEDRKGEYVFYRIGY